MISSQTKFFEDSKTRKFLSVSWKLLVLFEPKVGHILSVNVDFMITPVN